MKSKPLASDGQYLNIHNRSTDQTHDDRLPRPRPVPQYQASEPDSDASVRRKGRLERILRRSRRLSIRTVKSDDLLVDWGANPRTGVPSPQTSTTCKSRNGKEEKQKPTTANTSMSPLQHAARRSNSGGWKQDHTSWHFVQADGSSDDTSLLHYSGSEVSQRARPIKITDASSTRTMIVTPNAKAHISKQLLASTPTACEEKRIRDYNRSHQDNVLKRERRELVDARGRLNSQNTVTAPPQWWQYVHTKTPPGEQQIQHKEPSPKRKPVPQPNSCDKSLATTKERFNQRPSDPPRHESNNMRRPSDTETRTRKPSLRDDDEWLPPSAWTRDGYGCVVESFGRLQEARNREKQIPSQVLNGASQAAGKPGISAETNERSVADTAQWPSDSSKEHTREPAACQYDETTNLVLSELEDQEEQTQEQGYNRQSTALLYSANTVQEPTYQVHGEPETRPSDYMAGKAGMRRQAKAKKPSVTNKSSGRPKRPHASSIQPQSASLPGFARESQGKYKFPKDSGYDPESSVSDRTPPLTTSRRATVNERFFTPSELDPEIVIKKTRPRLGSGKMLGRPCSVSISVKSNQAVTPRQTPSEDQWCTSSSEGDVRGGRSRQETAHSRRRPTFRRASSKILCQDYTLGYLPVSGPSGRSQIVYSTEPESRDAEEAGVEARPESRSLTKLEENHHSHTHSHSHTHYHRYHYHCPHHFTVPTSVAGLPSNVEQDIADSLAERYEQDGSVRSRRSDRPSASSHDWHMWHQGMECDPRGHRQNATEQMADHSSDAAADHASSLSSIDPEQSHQKHRSQNPHQDLLGCPFGGSVNRSSAFRQSHKLAIVEQDQQSPKPNPTPSRHKVLSGSSSWTDLARSIQIQQSQRSSGDVLSSTTGGHRKANNSESSQAKPMARAKHRRPTPYPPFSSKGKPCNAAPRESAQTVRWSETLVRRSVSATSEERAEAYSSRHGERGEQGCGHKRVYISEQSKSGVPKHKEHLRVWTRRPRVLVLRLPVVKRSESRVVGWREWMGRSDPDKLTMRPRWME